MAQEILIRYAADTAEVEKALKDIDAQYEKIEKGGKDATDAADKGMKKVAKSTDSLSQDFRNLATTIAGAFAIQQVVSFGLELNKLGIQLETTGKRMEVVFGNARGVVEQEARKMSQALGLSINQFELMATKAGDILVPLGVNRKEAAKMSAEIVKLAGALSEFSAGTVDTEQAVHAVTSALTGEREMLKTLGVVLKEEDIKARLAAKGQGELEGQALSTAKAIATLELVSEKSADAQTFFAENSNSAARQSAELKARIQTLREEMARKLMPIFNEITKRLVTFFENIKISDIADFARAIGSLVAGFTAYKLAIKGATIANTLFSKGIGGIVSVMNPVTGLVGLVTAGVTALMLYGSESRRAAKEQELYNAALDADATAQREFNTTLNEALTDMDAAIRKEIELARARGASNEELAKLSKEGAAALIEQAQKQKDVLDAQVVSFTEYEDRIKALRSEAEAIRNMPIDAESRNTGMADLERQQKLLDANAEAQAKLNDAMAIQLGMNPLLANQITILGTVDARRNEAGEEFNRLLQFQDDLQFKNHLEELTRKRQLTEKEQKELKKQRDAYQKMLDAKKKADEQAIKDKEKAIAQEQKMFADQLKHAEESINENTMRRKIALNEQKLDTETHNEQLFNIEVAHLQSMIGARIMWGQTVTDLELKLSELIRNNHKKTFEVTEEQILKTTEILVQGAENTNKILTESTKDTIQAVSLIGQSIISLARQISDESLGLAIFEILLNKAVAISEVILAAIPAGGGNPVLTSANIAALTGIVIGGFAEVAVLLNQATQAKESGTIQGFATGGIAIGGDGSSTGDGLLVRISPRESIINADSTRKYTPELIAINNGTFDSFVNERYIRPAMSQAGNPIINVDGGFNDANLLSVQKRINDEERKRHRELMGALKSSKHRGRKNWY